MDFVYFLIWPPSWKVHISVSAHSAILLLTARVVGLTKRDQIVDTDTELKPQNTAFSPASCAGSQ